MLSTSLRRWRSEPPSLTRCPRDPRNCLDMRHPIRGMACTNAISADVFGASSWGSMTRHTWLRPMAVNSAGVRRSRIAIR